MSDTMTPAAFVAIVEPHLPVGIYTGAKFAPHIGDRMAFRREVHLSRSDGHGSHFAVDDAANLLLGAIVAEWPYGFYLWRFGIGDDTYRCEIHTCDEANGVSLHNGTAPTPLEAALLARAAARKAQQ